MKKIDFEAHIAGKSYGEAMSKIAPPPPKGARNPFALNLEERIALMDQYGVQVQIASGPGGLERFDRETAIHVAQGTNDELYEMGQASDGRILGYANLIPQDVDASLKELERCKYELGFPAWNAYSNFTDTYIDEDQYFPLLQRAAELDMFVYLHPGPPSISRLNGLGPMLSKGLGYHVDACITILRLVCKGVFDRIPNLKVFMGHMGEAMPFMLERIDSMAEQSAARKIGFDGQGPCNKHPLSYYFKNNIWITTSGNFSPSAFRCAKETIGLDRICLGTDFPIESYEQTFAFFDSLGLSDEELAKLYYQNAEEHFGLYI